ncbi:MAG: twin-arginine translocase TatA/TatE family subunit [Thermacetogeniaceae bacterium]
MFGLIPSLGPWELIAILVIVLIIFGPGKLPEVGKSLGKTIREFRKASTEITDQVEGAVVNGAEKGEAK